MTALPRVSLPSQINAVQRASGRLDGTSSPPFTEGQIALEIRDLAAAIASLQYLEANREWIVDAVKARREAGR